MSWAHLASGGAGGGMRWPNRHPHVLTQGMRRSQKAMAGFLPLINWQHFRRVPVSAVARGFHAFACGDADQAIVDLLRRSALLEDGRIDIDRTSSPQVELMLSDGSFRVMGWDPALGAVTETVEVVARDGRLCFTAHGMRAEKAFAIL